MSDRDQASVPDAVPQERILRYSNTAVAIHWVTVVLVLFQIWLGFSFADLAPGPERGQLFTWHKTIGALILLATIARLTYRMINPPQVLIHQYALERRLERLGRIWTLPGVGPL